MNSRVTTAIFSAVLIGVGGCCPPSSSSCLGNASTNQMGDHANIPLAEAGKEIADIYFKFDSSALDKAAKETLNQGAEWLKVHAERSVQIEGHCDERGTNEYNLALGERRARSAYDYLRSLGIEAKRMSTISYGEELPLDPGHNETAWSKNRRAHFKVK